MWEAVTILDLDVLFYPCPKGGLTHRPRVRGDRERDSETERDRGREGERVEGVCVCVCV